MTIDFAALKTELTTDPRGYGYAAALAAGQDWRLAELLNQVRAGITVRRPDIAPAEVLEAIDSRDFLTTVGAAQAAWLESICQQASGRIRLLNDDGSGTTALGNIKRMLLPANDTNYKGSRERLDAIANRAGSRAEELFGVGATVAATDIARALRG